ncbi:MAG: MGMT family protein, partial [Dehalococcoidales bacterium]|nr:MGMT family protein [Dehalococcoidales bacterium]
YKRQEFHRATPFRRAVWEATRSIPYGVTKGYRWVAERAGRAGAVRAVGQALSRNPYPVVVPCHRVIGSDGSPGGYSGGPALKRLLLRLEGCLPGT